MAMEEEIEHLEQHMADLSVRDQVRQLKLFSLPDVTLVNDFERLGFLMSGKRPGQLALGRKRALTSCFGAPPVVMAKLWELIVREGPLPKRAKREHLLWALYYLYEYTSMSSFTIALL